MQLGLVGRSLGHSFSKAYFENKFRELGLKGYTYENFELENIAKLKTLLAERPLLSGLNVTLPYKEQVVPLLDEMEEDARRVGAVNCIKISGGQTKGFNTDVYGFSQSIKPFLDNKHERALILGTGGASKAVAFALRRLGVEVLFAGRTANEKAGVLAYESINDHVLRACKLVVNTTPLGMFPHTDQYPSLPYHAFTSEHLAFDLIYNPDQTEFLKRAGHHGAVTMNGLSMLKLQAERSWEIWHQ